MRSIVPASACGCARRRQRSNSLPVREGIPNKSGSAGTKPGVVAMKSRVFPIFVALVVTVCSCSTVRVKTEEPDSAAAFSAGAAEVQITHTTDRSRVHHDMFARALVISDGSNKLAVLTVDVIAVGADLVLQVKEGIKEATGIPVENITMNVSHTHNGWPSMGAKWHGDQTYGEWLAERCVEIACRANEELRPCMIAYDREPIQIGFNRRLMWNDSNIIMAINPDGPVAAWTDVIGIYDHDGRRIAVLFTYAAHPVITQYAKVPGTETEIVSSDYPGSAISQLKEYVTNYGEFEMTGLFMFGQGCGGNINGFPLRGGPEACDASGSKLAGAVTRASLQELTPGKLRSVSLTLNLPYADPPTVEKAEALLEENPGSPRAEKLLRIAKEGKKDLSKPYMMMAMSVGPDLCILSLPYETFVDYELFANRVSPFKYTLVLGYCNGGAGYIATKADYELGAIGGYEASPYANALDTPVGLPLDPSVEKTIKKGIAEIFRKLERAD
jgi:neutral ceramidase